jgi:hypothetical protein
MESVDMESVDGIGEGQIVAAVAAEAVDELVGTSNRKWAVMLVAFVLGAIVAGIVIRRRSERSPDALEQE